MRSVAVITGASGGIGRACAIVLAQAGWQVVALYHHHPERLTEAASQLHAFAGQIDSFPCDLEKSEDVRTCFEQIYRLYHQVDLLVCAAGIAHIGLFSDVTEDIWHHIMSVNLDGAYRCIHAVLPNMISRKKGNIITISSMWGETGASCEVAYSASKAALIGLTKALAKEVGPSGIRVNCVSPGLIATPMNDSLSPDTLASLRDDTPLGRIGTPEDVAEAVHFLASPQSSFITGQVLGVSGGYQI